jgi:hypothetical protein
VTFSINTLISSSCCIYATLSALASVLNATLCTFTTVSVV